MRTVNLGNVAVGGDHPPYIVAEVGSNHNGDMDLCLRLIDAAAEAGANAVKFQSWSEPSWYHGEKYRSWFTKEANDEIARLKKLPPDQRPKIMRGPPFEAADEPDGGLDCRARPPLDRVDRRVRQQRCDVGSFLCVRRSVPAADDDGQWSANERQDRSDVRLQRDPRHLARNLG